MCVCVCVCAATKYLQNCNGISTDHKIMHILFVIVKVVKVIGKKQYGEIYIKKREEKQKENGNDTSLNAIANAWAQKWKVY